MSGDLGEAEEPSASHGLLGLQLGNRVMKQNLKEGAPES